MLKIGYNVADLREMMRENFYYIDRSIFLPILRFD